MNSEAYLIFSFSFSVSVARKKQRAGSLFQPTRSRRSRLRSPVNRFPAAAAVALVAACFAHWTAAAAAAHHTQMQPVSVTWCSLTWRHLFAERPVFSLPLSLQLSRSCSLTHSPPHEARHNHNHVASSSSESSEPQPKCIFIFLLVVVVVVSQFGLIIVCVPPTPRKTFSSKCI